MTTPDASRDAKRASIPADAVVRLARDHSGQVLAALARRFNDLDLADEAVQEALIEASQRWTAGSIPDNPGGWLYRVAQRKALDRLRRAGAEQRRLEAHASELLPVDDDVVDAAAGSTMLIEDGSDEPLDDERLRLILLCCHPALHLDAQVALTLRLVGGLTTEEIAAAFLVPVPTMAARVTRAKKKIRQANIPLHEPENLDERIDAVLAVLYLIFNEGYLSRSSAADAIRVDLCDEAIRLAQAVASLAAGNAEARGLLALLLLTHARRDARFSGQALVPLDEQDRGQWHLNEIRAANQLLGQAMQMMRPGRYQLQALIASNHSNARTAADTDWTQITALYDQLLAMRPSPVVALNRAVAVAMADGPLAGLRELDQIDGLDDYHLLHATRGELLMRSGERSAAKTHFERARALTANPSERAHIDAKLNELT